MLRYGEEIGRLLLTAPGYSAYVRTFSCRRGQTIRMVTATNVTFLTVASSHRPLVPAGSTLNTVVVLNRRLGWLPSVGGNKADLFSDYGESIAAMAREVRTAERYVHVEFYIMSWDATCALTHTRWNQAMWCARWFPADRVSRMRTTFDCSTR